MVGIVAVTRFCEAGSSEFASYIDYIDRSSATQKDNLDKYNLFNEYLGYMDNDTKTIINDYRAGTEKVSALFTREDMSLDQAKKTALKEVFEIAQKNGSNMWQTVLSFDNKYLEEIGVYDSSSGKLNEKIMMQAGRAAINKMLEKEGLENAVYAASFHYNTDNIHIHVATVEPTPMREKRVYKKWEKDADGKYKTDANGKKIPVLDKDGHQETYEAFKGTYKQSSIEAAKSTLRSELENNKETYSEITALLRTMVTEKKNVKLLDSAEFTDKMSKLYENIKTTGTSRQFWNYNQNTLSALKPQIDDLSTLYIKTYHTDLYEDLIAKMGAESLRQAKAFGGKNRYIENQLYDKQSGLYTRMGNAILKELQAYDKARSNQINPIKLANQYLDANSKDYNPEKALKILIEQSNRGNTYAHNRLGIFYLTGSGKDYPKDISKARMYFMRSAEAGNAFGEKMMKNINSKANRSTAATSFCKRDFRKAVRTLQRDLNNISEQYKNIREAEELAHEIETRGDNIDM